MTHYDHHDSQRELPHSDRQGAQWIPVTRRQESGIPRSIVPDHLQGGKAAKAP